MKIGIIGCGGMGTTHYLSLRALAEQEGVEVTCIAECRKEFLDKAASYFPNARTYEYGMDLIKNEELDIVHICLPSYMHAEHAIAALEKGMNVFVEKPVCLTEEDCQTLLEAEKRTGKKVMVGQVVRSFEEYKFLKDAYDTKKYGRLKSMVMQRISGDVRWGFENWFHDEMLARGCPAARRENCEADHTPPHDSAGSIAQNRRVVYLFFGCTPLGRIFSMKRRKIQLRIWCEFGIINESQESNGPCGPPGGEIADE